MFFARKSDKSGKVSSTASLSQRELTIARREASIKQKFIDFNDNSKQIAFTFYVIAIAAKLAQVDSSNRSRIEEIRSFKEIFSVSKNHYDKIDDFYNSAADDVVQGVHYARQLTNLFPNNRLLLEELINDLFVFADADDPLTSNKVRFLKEIVLALNFNEKFFKRVLHKHVINFDHDPYKLLNVPHNVKYVDLKKAYRRVIKDYHPDKFEAKEVAPELKEVAAEQFNYYQQAFEKIRGSKGFALAS